MAQPTTTMAGGSCAGNTPLVLVRPYLGCARSYASVSIECPRRTFSDTHVTAFPTLLQAPYHHDQTRPPSKTHQFLNIKPTLQVVKARATLSQSMPKTLSRTPVVYRPTSYSFLGLTEQQNQVLFIVYRRLSPLCCRVR